MSYRHIVDLGNGAIFGEKGLDDDVPRAATVITSKNSHLAVINRKEYRLVLKDIFRIRKERQKKFVVEKVFNNKISEALAYKIAYDFFR